MLRTLDLRGHHVGDPLDLPRPDIAEDEPVAQVREILAEVRRGGDAALRALTKRLDGADLAELRVSPDEIEKALATVPGDLVESLRRARTAIDGFHRHRAASPGPYEADGVTINQVSIPVERVGVYAPGGRATYPSSVLMTVIPAQVAGVESIACCTPPGPDGAVAPAILAAAAICGVDEIYRVGGAQAVGALAFGTETIRKVDVIVGPGSKWVTLAKREVAGIVGIPSGLAGPSEVVVVADDSVPAEWAAIDVVVQAEHGPDGFAWLVTWSSDVAERVGALIEGLVARSPRAKETAAALATGGYVVIVDGPEEAIDVVNAIAPEHLELMVADPEALVKLVRHAGAIFLGPYAPASVGDYIAGPSHVLPTFGSARFASVLGVDDFLRHTHTIRLDESGIARVAGDVATIAEAERLPAHAESVRMRIGKPTWSAS